MTLNDVALHVLLFDFFHPTGRLRVCKIRFASTSENHRKLCPILKRPVFLVFCSFFCVESQSKGGKSQKSSKTQVQREETDDNGADILAREAKTIAER